MVQNIVEIAHVMESEEEKECVARVAKDEGSERRERRH
jgi:hypothetical protein